MKNPIIVITGPTASGKTSLSFEVAKKFPAEIICVDSMTVYRGMDIGTDKPTLQIPNFKIQKPNQDGSYTIKGIKHHLLDIVDPDEEFNVSHFADLVNKKINEIHQRKHIPFLVGGSAMYLDAILYKYNFPTVEPDKKLRKELEKKTNEELFHKLVRLDPDVEWTIDKNNRRRLTRALEVCLKTGKPFSKQKTKESLPGNVLYLAVDRPRELLYKSINMRVDEMVKMGFVTEVRGLYKKYDSNTAMQAAGYRQLIQFIEGKTGLDEAIEKTKQVHRNFAKRQLTWFKKNKDIIWVDSPRDAEKKITNFLKS